jgi:energy-coupling factor transport system permease protein
MKAEGKASLLSRLHPLVKVGYSLLVSLLIVLLTAPAQLVALALSTLAVLLLARIPLRRFKVLFFVVLSIVGSTMASQAFFYYFEPRTVLLTVVPERFPFIGRVTGGIFIYKEGIVYGSIQSLRLISATFMATAVAVSIHPSEFLVWLRRLRLPRELGLVLIVSIRFMPQLVEEIKRILLGLRLRGVRTKGIANTLKAFRLLLPPLVINSLRQARMLALAAEVRGFSTAKSSSASGLARFIRKFTTVDLVVIAFFISLLYLAALPFKMGLSRIPFIHAFLFSVPFTCVLFMGIRVVPKCGTATLIICGNSLLGQMVSRGVNPLWWPYPIGESLILEAFFLLARDYVRTSYGAVAGGALRGLVMYLYFYLVSAPFIWHKFYAPWYVTVETLQGVTGSALGGFLGYRIGRAVESAYKHGTL